MPSDSGEKLSPSRFGNAAQRRVLDQHRQVAHLQRAELERFELRQLQAAQPHFADARAQRVGDRPDALALRGLARDDRLLRAGVEHEVLEPAAVDARLDDDLVLHQRKGIVCSMFRSCSSISTGVESPNESRKSTCARAHAAFSLRSLLGSRLM